MTNLDRVIAGVVTLSPAWREIVPTEPLKPEREIHQVVLFFPPAYEPDYVHWGIHLPDNSTVIPEVQLVDQDGQIYKLKVGALGRTEIGYSYRNDSHDEVLPKDKAYRAVRIRSDKPIEMSKVVWRCYDPWDYK